MTIETKTTAEYTITADGIQALTVSHDSGSSRIVICAGRLVVSLGQAKDLVEVLNKILAKEKPAPLTSKTEEVGAVPLRSGQKVRLKLERIGYYGDVDDEGVVVGINSQGFSVRFTEGQYKGSTTDRDHDKMSDFEVIE